MSPLSGPWPARLTWTPLPLTVGPALDVALDSRSTAVALTAAGMAWVAWAGVLVAVLVPRTVSCTALRIAAPAVAVVAIWAAAVGEGDGVGVLAVGWAALVGVAAFSPLTGDAFIDGSSYGDERRLPLRVPSALLAGPLPVAWLAVVAGIATGPLLLAARQWVVGALALAAGLPLARVAAVALHGLARRWVVFVPAGLVLHDPATLVDPVLFPRTTIRRLGPAPPDPEGALDLTQRALGLVLELELLEPAKVAPRGTGRTVEVEVVEVDRLLFTPTRPGAVLHEARRRRIAVA